MRTAWTIATTHSGKAEILHGEDEPLTAHRDNFRALPTGKSHPKYAKIQVIHSDGGVVNTRKFLSPEEEKHRTHAAEKAAAHEAKLIAEHKAAEEKAKHDAEEKERKKQEEFVKRETEKQKHLAKHSKD